jgi:superoxide dismutase, Cu-Zn family
MSIRLILIGILGALVIAFGMVNAQEATPELQQPGATAVMQDASGNDVGQVTFTQRGDGKIVVLAQVKNLSPGFHGFHVDETGVCDASSKPPFTSAGSHLSLMTTFHDDHSGDLPVLLITTDGTGELMVVTDRFKLASLLDDDGSAVVIDAGVDNFANIPERYGQPDDETLTTGDSGSRIACGVIQPDADVTAG